MLCALRIIMYVLCKQRFLTLHRVCNEDKNSATCIAWLFLMASVLTGIHRKHTLYAIDLSIPNKFNSNSLS